MTTAVLFITGAVALLVTFSVQAALKVYLTQTDLDVEQSE